MRLSATRGRLRVYLGVAPGAGATCALLGEGHRRAEKGADVVVAGVQTSGRPVTAGMLEGLEIIPPVTPESPGAAAGDMDVGALLAEDWSGQKPPAQVEAAANQALGFLERALAAGYGRDRAATDRDLEGIRNHPQFQRLLPRNRGGNPS